MKIQVKYVYRVGLVHLIRRKFVILNFNKPIPRRHYHGHWNGLNGKNFFDERKGRVMNSSLAEHHVPVNADVPDIDIIFNDIPDKYTPLGAHGIGEIGIAATAATIANAVINATGKRMRSLLIHLISVRLIKELNDIFSLTIK
jgi:hypothetical protein